MHFRIRKNVIQLIRTTYDESKKKGNSAIIGTVPMAKPQLSEELRRKLTVEEVATHLKYGSRPSIEQICCVKK